MSSSAHSSTSAPGTNKKLVVLELLAATMLWGFSFVAAKIAVAEVGPFWLCVLRNAIALVVIAPVLALTTRDLRSGLRDARLAAPAGLCLAATLVLQTAGLVTTSAANSGFLTGLYVLFVPMFTAWLGYERLSRRHFIYVGLALVGAALMAQLGKAPLNRGDGLTLLGAVVVAGQIVAVGRAGPKVHSLLWFNAGQSLWCGGAALLVAVPYEPLAVRALSTHGMLSVLFLSLGATLLAFLLQVRAQRTLPASQASLLFLLESPFAALFGFLCLDETLTSLQLFGAAILLSATVLAVVSPKSNP